MKNVVWVLLRALLVGVGYILGLMVVGNLLGALGVSLGSAGEGMAMLPWLFVSGVLIALLLGPLASKFAASRPQQLVVWSCAIFFNRISTLIEGSFFAPALIGAKGPGLALQQLLLDVLTATLIVWLFAPRQNGRMAASPFTRSWPQWAWRFVLSAFSYLVFYFIFGALNYAWVTKPFYDAQAGGISVPAPQVVLMAEAVRAPLIVLAVLPFILLARRPRRELAALCGLILFVAGGIVPLLLQINALPAFLLAASGVEIFFQNFLTGVVSAFLLGPPAAQVTPASANRTGPRALQPG